MHQQAATKIIFDPGNPYIIQPEKGRGHILRHAPVTSFRS
jgi:hypothetical protein